MVTKRKCDNCKKEYFADSRNLKRGWGLCCSKSCAAKKREKSKPKYDPITVQANNIKRKNWNRNRTDEGYKIIDGTAYNEFDNPVYDVGELGNYDPADSEYWDNKDF